MHSSDNLSVATFGRARFPLHSPVCAAVATTTLVALLGATSAAAAIFSVGPGGDCTHSTLAAAVAAAAANGSGSDEVHLTATQTLAGPLDINNQSLVIRGGYATCSGAPTASTTSVSFTSGDGFRVLGGTALRIVTLRNLAIIMGVSAGRSLTIQDQSAVFLFDTLLSSGSAVDGGNVKISGGQATLYLGAGARVYSGDATGDGGGIHCSLGSAISVVTGAKIEQNHADSDGGGVYLDDCAFDTSAGGVDTGIFLNSAGGLGGGIHARNGAQVTLTGNASNPASLRDNNAHWGGGIYLSGAGTTVEAINSWIDDNFTTSTYGGGIYVENGAGFDMHRSGSCHAGRDCSRLKGNAAAPVGARGGAIAVSSGGQARIRQTYFTANQAQSTGSIAFVEDAGSYLLIEGSMLWGNYLSTALNQIVAEDGALVRLAQISTASNLSPSAGLLAVGLNATIELMTSVLGESTGSVFKSVDASATRFVDCVIVRETATLPPDASEVWVGTDPALLFVNPASGDLHARRTSEAIDSCDGFYWTPTDRDLDDQEWAWDDPSWTNYLGAYDRGADEARPIFVDGFESGGTGGWSSAVG